MIHVYFHHIVPPLNHFSSPASHIFTSNNSFSILVKKLVFSIHIELPLNSHPNMEVTEKKAVVWSCDRDPSSI